ARSPVATVAAINVARVEIISAPKNVAQFLESPVGPRDHRDRFRKVTMTDLTAENDSRNATERAPKRPHGRTTEKPQWTLRKFAASRRVPPSAWTPSDGTDVSGPGSDVPLVDRNARVGAERVEELLGIGVDTDDLATGRVQESGVHHAVEKLAELGVVAGHVDD